MHEPSKLWADRSPITYVAHTCRLPMACRAHAILSGHCNIYIYCLAMGGSAGLYIYACNMIFSLDT